MAALMLLRRAADADTSRQPLRFSIDADAAATLCCLR